MAGAVGGGGLGDLAIRYGYQRFETEVMIATVVVLVVSCSSSSSPATVCPGASVLTEAGCRPSRHPRSRKDP